jgi:ABC-type cobalamin/Fe3+-siderophores transport system ATPase subunit
MSITAITIEDFKGIREPVLVELKPITLLFGPNSAGKSTIIQALHYAREIFERQNLNPDTTISGGKSVNLGGFVALVNDNDLSKPVMLCLELDLERIDLSDYFIGENNTKDTDSIPGWKNVIFECLNKVNIASIFVKM